MEPRFLLLQVDYLLGYACAGSMFQFCVLPRDSKVANPLGHQLSMATRADKLSIIAAAIQVYRVIKAQFRSLPDSYMWSTSDHLSTIE